MKHIIHEIRESVERWLMIDDEGREHELFRRPADAPPDRPEGRTPTGDTGPPAAAAGGGLPPP